MRRCHFTTIEQNRCRCHEIQMLVNKQFFLNSFLKKSLTFLAIAAIKFNHLSNNQVSAQGHLFKKLNCHAF